MQKITLNVLTVLAGLCATLLHAAPSIEKEEEQLDRKGTAVLLTRHTVNLGNGKINYHTVTQLHDNKPVQQEWGDFRFGIEYWRNPNTPARWSPVSFLTLIGQDGKTLLDRKAAEKIDIVENGNMEMAAFTFRPENSVLDVRIAQFKDRPDWLFVKVIYPGQLHEVWASPVHGYGKPELESQFGLKEGDWKKPCGKPDWILTKTTGGNGLMNFNLYAYKEFGTFIVFEKESLQQIRIHGDDIKFELKPKSDSFSFAVSYFKDRNPEEVRPEFFNVTVPEVESFLKSINWNPAPDRKAFSRLADETRKNISILKMDGGNVADYEKEVNKLETDFAETPSFEILATLRELNRKIIKKNLENL
ncbi:MAG: hypothetical protein LUE13_01070 [Akkermansiaceae bacterium]|nr:hypothetical protein [Akkermansiaceae bacterium]